MALHENLSEIPAKAFDLASKLGLYADFDHLTQEQCDGLTPDIVKTAGVTSGLYAIAPHQESRMVRSTHDEE